MISGECSERAAGAVGASRYQFRVALGLLALLLLDWRLRLLDSYWLAVASQSALFRCAFFETWWATVCYAVLSYPVCRLAESAAYARYRLRPDVHFCRPGWLGIARDAVIYCGPLMLLDCVTVKRYHGWGIEPAGWDSLASAGWPQTVRLLPREAPSLLRLLAEVLGALILFDAAFFVLHLAMHRVPLLYRQLHSRHHRHPTGLGGHVTNQLTVAERLLLILAANESLKALQAHPLSRAAFVPAFVWLLLENHSGMDLPWGYRHWVPFGLSDGAVGHFWHHATGSAHYQPFFNYLDRGLTWWLGGLERPLPLAKDSAD